MHRRVKFVVMSALLVGMAALVGTPMGRIWVRHQDTNVRALVHEIQMLHPRFASR